LAGKPALNCKNTEERKERPAMGKTHNHQDKPDSNLFKGRPGGQGGWERLQPAKKFVKEKPIKKKEKPGGGDLSGPVHRKYQKLRSGRKTLPGRKHLGGKEGEGTGKPQLNKENQTTGRYRLAPSGIPRDRGEEKTVEPRQKDSTRRCEAPSKFSHQKTAVSGLGAVSQGGKKG